MGIFFKRSVLILIVCCVTIFADSDGYDVFFPSMGFSYESMANERYEDLIIDENDVLFAVGAFGIKKFDVSNRNDIKLLNSQIIDKNYRKRSAVVYDNYLFVTLRALNSSVNPQGYLHIYDKNTLQLLNVDITYDVKPTDLAVYDHYLLVGGLRNFKIYDIQNPWIPDIVYETNLSWTESQGIDLFSVNEKTYAFVCNFDKGITIYDITNPKKTKIVVRKTFADVCDGEMCVSGVNHTFDVHVEYPYAYSTMSVMAKNAVSDFEKKGVMTWDLSNLEDVKLLSVTRIPTTDLAKTYVYDAQPTAITKVNNFIVVNNCDKGFAAFYIGENGKIEYYGTFFDERSSVMAVLGSDDGYLYVGDERLVLDKNQVNMSVYKLSNENVLFVEPDPLMIASKSTMELALHLRNAENVSALQFDLRLPQEFSFTYDDNENLLSFFEEKSYSNNFDLFAYNMIDRNVLRVVVASSTNAFFPSGSEAILKLAVTVPTGINPGKYVFDLSNIQLVQDKENVVNLSCVKSNVEVPKRPLGDTNGDWLVSVSDYSPIMEFILGKRDDIDMAVADVNNDGKISVADLVGLSEFIMTSSYRFLMPTVYSNLESRATFDLDETFSNGQEFVELKISFEEFGLVDGVQFDVRIPQGLELLDTNFARSLFSEQESDAVERIEMIDELDYRVVAFSMNHDYFNSSNEGPLILNFKKSPQFDGGVVKIENIVISYEGKNTFSRDTLFQVSPYQEPMSISRHLNLNRKTKGAESFDLLGRKLQNYRSFSKSVYVEGNEVRVLK